MKKNAAFLYELFRSETGPCDLDADSDDPSEVIPPDAEAVTTDDHVPDEEWRFPWETVEPDPESRPGLIELDGVTWVRRPDHAGRFGWEQAGLRPEDRWWARCEFDELPDPPKGLVVGSLRKPANTASKLE